MDERVKEFLQKNKPMPATPEEKRKLKGIQLKTIFIILAIMAVSLVIGLVKSDLVVILVIGAIFSVIVLILDIKDKIKYMTYKQIETRHIYVDNAVFVNSGYQLRIQYYDFETYEFTTDTMFVDKLDILNKRIQTGDVVKMLVGVNNSKLYYISLK